MPASRRSALVIPWPRVVIRRPNKQRLSAAPTVEEIATQYLALYAKVHKKSWREDARFLAKDVLPQWGQRKAYDIRRGDVLALLDQIVERARPLWPTEPGPGPSAL